MALFDTDLVISALLVTATALVSVVIMRKRRRQRRFKTRPLNRNRNKNSVYINLLKFAQENDKEQFFKYTRMSPLLFTKLLAMVSPYISRRPTTDSICAGQRLSMTLHYLAEGCSMQEIAWNNCVGKTTASLIIKETCEVLWEVLSPLVLSKLSKNNYLLISDEFYNRWNIPNCIGAIDGKLVQIQAPKHSGSEYFSYKKSFSIILLAMCDANYKFTMMDVGMPGSNGDGRTFRESNFGQALFNSTLDIPGPRKVPGTNTLLPHFIIADQAFPLHKNIMRPYPGAYLPEAEKIFNYRLSRARMTIEISFGILAQRWRRLRNPIIAETCKKIILTTVVLHNFILKSEEQVTVTERQYFSEEYRREMSGEKLQSVGRVGANNASRDAFAFRNALKLYFLSDVGDLPHQWNYIRAGGIPQTF